MSSLTEFLKLFKWDKNTDGSEKFNIDTALNENWDKIEANAKSVDTALANKMNLYKTTKALSTKGWYRVAQFNGTGNYIVNIAQKYNNQVPSNLLLSVDITSNMFNISILDCSANDSNNTLAISHVRIVKDANSIIAPTFLEIYYNYAASNDIKVQVLNDTSEVNLINFTETTDENIFVKAIKTMKILHLDDAINTNKNAIGTLSSLTTTDKTSLVNAINEINTRKELWTNPDVTSDFSEQTITLNDNISNYKYYEILYNLGNASTNMQNRVLSTGKIPINKFAYMQSFTNYMFWRIVSSLSDTSIKITNNQYYPTMGSITASTDNSRNIPYKIIGYKN